MSKPKPEWWTFWGGTYLCSRHSTLLAAKKAALRCERRGGAWHTIVKVTPVESWRKGGAK